MKLLYEIPIYSFPRERVTQFWEDKYSRDISTREDKQEIVKALKQAGYPANCWKFNEIVGYVSIFLQNQDIVASLAYDARERTVIGGKARIRIDPSTLFRVCIRENRTSTEVMDELKSRIEYESKHHRWLKKRYIYTEAFYNVAENLDWHSIVWG